MSSEQLKIAAGLLGVVAVTVAAVFAGQWLARRKLERWARSQGFRLLEFKGAPAWRGPRAWRRTENQEDYEVLVEDAAGRRRRGWLLYTSPWHSLGPQRVEVTWDESS
jgi:hypothetical protein